MDKQVLSLWSTRRRQYYSFYYTFHLSVHIFICLSVTGHEALPSKKGLFMIHISVHDTVQSSPLSKLILVLLLEPSK